MHCCQEFSRLTWDHVFPVSWYPDSRASAEEKWKVPACEPCNGEYGTLENDLLVRFGLCLDPQHPASRGLHAKALRAIDPSLAKNEKDAAARRAKRQRIQRELLIGKEIPGEATIPGFGERWGRPTSEQVALPLPKLAIEKIGQKIVRGLFHLERAQLIDDRYEIEVLFSHSTSVADKVLTTGRAVARPPALAVQFSVAPDDHTTSVFRISFWEQLTMYAFVGQRGA